jgi:hypothetical protein
MAAVEKAHSVVAVAISPMALSSVATPLPG